MINDDAEFYVSFTEAGCMHSFRKVYEDYAGVSWREVHEDFLRFLSGAYGYDITSQVTVEGSKDPRQMDLFESYGGTE